MYVNDNKKLYFVIKIYGLIRVLSGYITIKNNLILIKYGKKKTYFSPLKNVFGLRKKIKPFLDLHLVNIKSLTEIGSDNDLISPFSYAFILQYINYYFCEVLNKVKPYLKIKNDVNVIENKSIFNVYLSFTIVFNFITVIASLLKILTEKIFYAKQSKQKQY